jgi:hypothetical protein
LRGSIPIVHFNYTLLKVQQQVHIVNNVMQSVARRISTTEHADNTSSMTRIAPNNITAERNNCINLKQHLLHDQQQHQIVCNGATLPIRGRAQPARRVWRTRAARSLHLPCALVCLRAMSPSPHWRWNKARHGG